MYTVTDVILRRCRSLIYEHEYSQFPCVNKLTELTYLQLYIREPRAHPDVLTNLCKLKELSIDNMANLQPLVISSAAELTRLRIEGEVVSYSHPALEASHQYHL